MIEMTDEDWKLARTVHVHFADPENEWNVLCHLQTNSVQHVTEIDPLAVTCPRCQLMPSFEYAHRIAQFAFEKGKSNQ